MSLGVLSKRPGKPTNRLPASEILAIGQQSNLQCIKILIKSIIGHFSSQTFLSQAEDGRMERVEEWKKTGIYNFCMTEMIECMLYLCKARFYCFNWEMQGVVLIDDCFFLIKDE